MRVCASTHTRTKFLPPYRKILKASISISNKPKCNLRMKNIICYLHMQLHVKDLFEFKISNLTYQENSNNWINSISLLYYIFKKYYIPILSSRYYHYFYHVIFIITIFNSFFIWILLCFWIPRIKFTRVSKDLSLKTIRFDFESIDSNK